MSERVPMSARLGCLAVLLALGVLAPGARAAGPPLVEATWVEGVTATAATLRAEINPNGFTTTYRFEYVDDATFQQSGFAAANKIPAANTPGIGQGTSLVKVSQHPAGLTPATVYHYRVWASNSTETVFGPERVLATQEPTNAFALPDNRGWELVSPVDKEGGAIQALGLLFGGGLDQAAIAGGAFTYSAATAFGAAPGAPPASQYLADRGSGAWQSQNISTPLRSGAYGEEPDGVPYRFFSEDLNGGLLFGGECRGEESQCAAENPPLPGSGGAVGYANYYLRVNTTAGFEALLDAGDVSHSTLGPKGLRAEVVAAAPDLSHVVISSCAALTPAATEVPGKGGCDGAKPNLYEWSATGLESINSSPGAEIAASLGAISGDGSRVYWRNLFDGNLYLHHGGGNVQVDQSTGGGGSFQAASADGSVAFFTKAGHLYRYLANAGAATDLTPGGGVVGVLGASTDGSSVYYQDAAGLWRWHEGELTGVAAGAGVADPSDYPPATGTARVSPDGGHLAFLSTAELSGADGAGFTQVYLYGAPPGGGAPVLVCASCNPSGERTQGPASLPGASLNGSTPTAYKPRALAASGQRLFFEAGDALAAQDTNSASDVYQWEAGGSGNCQRTSGCLSLISSGRSPGGATFLDASADGSDVFFLTDDSLVGRDPGSVDVYDARVNGGFAEAPKPISCIADACQALPPSPDDPSPGTLVPNSGNPPLKVVKEKHKHHNHSLHRHRGKKHRKGGRR